jgi:dipeptidyl aminopeptidase/acylaminoacyl peptidase
MKYNLKPFLFVLLLNTVALLAFAQAKRPITFDDMMALKRLSEAAIAPDGTRVAYTVADVDKNANRSKRSIWLVATSGSEAKPFITSDKNDFAPHWSADGKQIAFLSTRDGAPQIYVANADGTAARKVTDAPEGVSEFVWSPNGKLFAFTTDVYPDCASFNCVAKRAEAEEKSKVKAVIADRLLFRHWDSFKRGKRSHLFVISADGGEPKDLTPGDYDTPPFSLGDPTAFDFAPDSTEVAFARNTDKVEATSTNNELFLVSVNGGEAKRITNGGGSDTTPRYSPDGKYIAYRSQARNGYESDRVRLMLYDRKTGTTRELSIGFDRNVGDLLWSPNSQQLFLTVEDRAREALYVASLNGDKFMRVMNEHASTSFSISADGKQLAFTRASLTHPNEVFIATSDGKNVKQLSQANTALLAQLDLAAPEDVEYLGALKTKMHGFVVKPPNFDKTKKYPMVLLIHGGPQGAWLDSWSFRWNPQLFAARGYLVAALNPHGSTGYGQAFTEQISGDWGGAVYEDLMKGVDHLIKQGNVDPTRIGAAGGSYGGYMVNWMLGHTDRFKAMVSHAGVYNLTSMYATEELWFTDWEFKGTPWESELYAKWSPHLHAKNFKTPTLVIHGELDYRVPIGEGLQLYSTLQRKGVPSKLLYYPDEGHWILKPQNSELWYKTVLGWFDEWLKPNAATALR